MYLIIRSYERLGCVDSEIAILQFSHLSLNDFRNVLGYGANRAVMDVCEYQVALHPEWALRGLTVATRVAMLCSMMSLPVGAIHQPTASFNGQ
jgi:hypothetical protein